MRRLCATLIALSLLFAPPTHAGPAAKPKPFTNTGGCVLTHTDESTVKEWLGGPEIKFTRKECRKNKGRWYLPEKRQ